MPLFGPVSENEGMHPLCGELQAACPAGGLDPTLSTRRSSRAPQLRKAALHPGVGGRAPTQLQLNV